MNGLIAGSMIPDLEYFMRLDNVSTFSHNFWGVFLYDIPAALLVLTIYHQLLREQLIKNLPPFVKTRMTRFMNFNWPAYLRKNWIVVIYSLIIGIFTHLFWDGFTSGNGSFVVNNETMETQLTVFNTELYIYKIIKHLSSFIATVALFIFFFRLPKEKDVPTQSERFYWISIFVVAAAISSLQVITYYSHISLNQLIKKIVSSTLLAIFVISFYYKMNSKIRNTSG